MSLRPTQSPIAQRELDQALIQSGAARQERLSQLSERYPDHGPIWAALAEVHLDGRRTEEARHAAARALRLDTNLHLHFSPGLRQMCESLLPTATPPVPEHMYRNRVEADRIVHAPAPAPDTTRLRPSPVLGVPARARTPEQPAGTSASRPGSTRSSVGGSSVGGPSVGRRLAEALELEDREQRVAALLALRDAEPEHEGVLFHLAIECALTSRRNEARQAGEILRRMSPRRYEQLYSLAETHWPQGSQGELPEPQPVSQPSPYAARAIQLSPESAWQAPAAPAPAAARTVRIPAPAAPYIAPAPIAATHMAPAVAAAPSYRTHALPIPPAGLILSASRPSSVPAHRPLHPGTRPGMSEARHSWGTFAAVAAGVFAGIVVAVLIVLMFARAERSHPSSTPPDPAPTTSAAAADAPTSLRTPSTAPPGRAAVHRARRGDPGWRDMITSGRA